MLEALTHVAAERQVHAAVRVQGDELERVQPIGALRRIAQVGIILLVAQDIVSWRLIGESLGGCPGGIEKLLGTLLGAGARRRAEEDRPRQTNGRPPSPNVHGSVPKSSSGMGKAVRFGQRMAGFFCGGEGQFHCSSIWQRMVKLVG